jgi:segregation and condensation protein B
VAGSELRAILEALLFASDSPLSLSLLVETTGAEPLEIARALEELGAEYDGGGHGVQLSEMAGGYLVTTREAHAPWIRKLLVGRRKARLSRAALEALAIIAYKQPVTRPEIEAIRGVDSGSALATLLERDLITIRGRSEVVGRPLLYGTTAEFLSYFGLRELSELPRPEELKAILQAREAEADADLPEGQHEPDPARREPVDS